MIANRPSDQFNRSLGIRADEGQTVRLFFLHNFLLGIGTMLVYVTANVILLEKARNQFAHCLHCFGPRHDGYRTGLRLF